MHSIDAEVCDSCNAELEASQIGLCENCQCAHSVIGRRVVPLNAAQYAGQQAICVKLSTGFMAWGFGADPEAAEVDALNKARELDAAA